MKNNRKISKIGYDIVVFDCDSTLTGIEGINFLAKRNNKEKDVKILTEKAMNGEVKFEDVFSKRLNLIKPRKKDLEKLYRQYLKHRIKDAKKVISLLQKAGKKVYIITGGYQGPVNKFADYLGIPKENVFAVELKFDKNGDYLNYNVKNTLTKSMGKKKVLQKIKKLGSVIFVGDAAIDLEAKSAVDFFVGFGGFVSRPAVKKGADIFINFKSLTPLLSLAQGFKPEKSICFSLKNRL